MSDANKQISLPENDVDVQRLFDELLQKMRSYRNDVNEKRLRMAFDVADKAHRGQFRESGAPYIVHPLSVAHILTDYFVHEDTIVAALLHDVIEDNENSSLKDLRDMFGPTVAQLVEGATKVSELVHGKIDTPIADLAVCKATDAETIRKIFQKSKQDIRVVLIKLADRLHNMKTLDGVSDYMKRFRKAQETLHVFVPLAARLGIWKMKHELEELCFPYLFPNEYEQIQAFLRAERSNIQTILNSAMDVLKKEDKNGLIKEIHPYDRGIFYLKHALDERHVITPSDYLTLHVCVEAEDDCYRALGLIHKTWRVRKREEEDYISNPRDNGYKAYHTRVITEDGHRVEIRIVTSEMHMKNWYGSAYGLLNNESDADFFIPFETISKKTHGRSFEFIEAARTDLLDEKIEVHSSGQSIYVPAVSTVLDFVFYAFPKKALRTSRIFLNDQEISLDTPLQEGDIVDVDFDDQNTVAFRWFSLVKTAVARMSIQEALQRWQHEKKIEVGRKILQREFDIYQKGSIEKHVDRHKKQIKSLFGLNDYNDLYALIAEGNLQPYEVFSTVFPKTKSRLFARFMRKFYSVIGRATSGGVSVLRLKVVGVLEKEIEILAVLNSARRNLGMTVLSSNLHEDSHSNTFIFKISLVSENQKTLHDFVTLLEHQKGIVNVIPLLSYRKIRYFLSWVFITVLLWGIFPFVLALEKHLIISIPQTFKIAFLYFNLIPVVIVNYILYSFMRNYFPRLRNSYWVIVIGLLLNFLGIGVFTWQLLMQGFKVNMYLVIALLSSLTFVFFYHYLSSVQQFEPRKTNKSTGVSLRGKLVGYVCALLVVAIWGVDPLIIRQLVLETNVLFTVGMRFYLGSVFLFFFLFLRYIFHRGKKHHFKIHYGPLFWVMALGLGVNFLLYHTGLRYTMASNANLIENFSPIAVLLMMGALSFGVAYQVGRTRSEILRTIFIVVLGSVGATLVLSYFPSEIIPNYSSKLLGDTIEVVAMIFFALFILTNNVYMKKYSHVSSLSVSAYILLFAGLAFTPFMIFSGIPKLTEQQWLSVLFIGLFSTGIAYALWSRAAKVLNVIPAVLILNFTVIVTMFLECRIYGVVPGIEMILGALLMITASVFAEIMNSKKLRAVKSTTR